MSCQCQCTNTLDFCDQDVCGEIDFDVLAQVEGDHTLKLDYLQTKITLTQSFQVEEKIIFPVTSLNENFQYTGELYDPNGVKIVISKNGVEYDCIKFNTVVNVSL